MSRQDGILEGGFDTHIVALVVRAAYCIRPKPDFIGIVGPTVALPLAYQFKAGLGLDKVHPQGQGASLSDNTIERNNAQGGSRTHQSQMGAFVSEGSVFGVALSDTRRMRVVCKPLMWPQYTLNIRLSAASNFVWGGCVCG